jgi:tetratricopeptide (TPR) repeat protein
MTNESFEVARIAAATARRRAKAIRSKWKLVELSAQRDAEFGAALQDLDKAIEALLPFASDTSAYRKDAEREIGDCLGVQGGAYRDWGKFGEAADAYDRGLPFERRFLELGGQPNSYCLVQRLVARVLKSPREFRSGLPIQGADTLVPPVDVNSELEASAEEIRQQKEVLRKGDPWAQADFALVLQLLGRETAEAEWDKFDDMRPDSGVYGSTLDVVRLLRQRLDLDADSQSRWEDLENRLASN